MPIAPTLGCPCGERMLSVTAVYDAPPAGETRFPLGAQDYRREYRACQACGHWFASHGLDLSSLYEGAYVDATYGGPDGMRRRFEAVMALPAERSDNRARVSRLLEVARGLGIVEPPTRLLDVGAGLGVFPSAMREAGWSVVAVEPDSRTVTHLRDVARVDALAIDIGAVDPAVHGRFDVITFNKVLEHVEAPQPMLAAARALLTPRGLVYVEVPDAAAVGEGAGREEFFIEHHHVFTPASLAMLLERTALAAVLVERLREPSGKFTLRAFARPA